VDLIEHASEHRLPRAAAPERLRELADDLARHNEVSFVREGVRHSIKVPKEIAYTLEIEVGESASEIEIEIKW
jgi:amphi-Trp domain-containing protein